MSENERRIPNGSSKVFYDDDKSFDLVSTMVSNGVIDPEDQIMIQLGLRAILDDRQFRIPRIGKVNNALIALALCEYGYVRACYLDCVRSEINLIGWLNDESLTPVATIPLAEEEMIHFLKIRTTNGPDNIPKYIYGKFLSKRSPIDRPEGRHLLEVIQHITESTDVIWADALDMVNKDTDHKYTIETIIEDAIMVTIGKFNMKHEPSLAHSDVIDRACNNMDRAWCGLDFAVSTEEGNALSMTAKEAIRKNGLEKVSGRFASAFMELEH